MPKHWWTDSEGKSKLESGSEAGVAKLIAGAPSARRIDEVIVHHTWEPRVGAYKGKATWQGIQNYHISGRGWSDIGYHLGIGPDVAGTRTADGNGVAGGSPLPRTATAGPAVEGNGGQAGLPAPREQVWLLRPLAKSGGHCLGHNDHSVGVVILGNFDKGKDDPTKLLPVAARMVKALCLRYSLQADDVYFHRDFADKSCPGTGIDRGKFRGMVETAGWPAVEGNGVAGGSPLPRTEERKWGFSVRMEGDDLIAEGIATTWDDHVTRTGIPADLPGIVACSLPRALCERTAGSPFKGVVDFALVKVWYAKTNRAIYAPVIDEGPAFEAQAGTGKPGMAMIDLTKEAKRQLGFAGPEVNDKVTVRVMAGQVWRPGMVVDVAKVNAAVAGG